MERVALRAEGGGNYFAAPKKGIRFIPSGCLLLDLALGGGWAGGRVVNIVGDKSTGKTLLCTEAAANFAIKYPKGKIRYRESEAAFDQPYARALGMPVDRIDFGDPMETVEDLFEDLERIVSGAKGPELFICDSLDALSDRAELERDMDKGSFGAEKAKKMSQLFRRLIRKLERKQITVIIVSQIRDKMNAMFGRKVTRTGGRALDFYASQVVYLAYTGRVTKTIKGQKRTTAIKVKALIDKNKISLPFREAEFKIHFGFGIDDAEACIEFLKDTKMFTPKTAQYHIDKFLEYDRAEYDTEIATMHALCTRQWYAIEKSLIPTRTKYGV